MNTKSLPTPHGDKLRALRANSKLPPADARLVEAAFERYNDWIISLNGLDAESQTFTAEAVDLLNAYRLFLDLEIVFDSADDFLYRQKGQLKLDNTVIEEFIPLLMTKTFGRQLADFHLGPRACYSAMYFASTLATTHLGPSLQIRSKDQDFAVARKLRLSASFDNDHQIANDSITICIGYLCAECKTNLDKTMFQEAIATANDVKNAAPGSKYLLLAEWLDMAPISPAGTNIDEVLILRKAKRLRSQVRAKFATREGRVAARSDYASFLRAHPFAVDVFERLLWHVRTLIEDRMPDEGGVLTRGYY